MDDVPALLLGCDVALVDGLAEDPQPASSSTSVESAVAMRVCVPDIVGSARSGSVFVPVRGVVGSSTSF